MTSGNAVWMELEGWFRVFDEVLDSPPCALSRMKGIKDIPG